MVFVVQIISEFVINSACVIFTVCWDKLFERLTVGVMPKIRTFMNSAIESKGGG